MRNKNKTLSCNCQYIIFIPYKAIIIESGQINFSYRIAELERLLYSRHTYCLETCPGEIYAKAKAPCGRGGEKGKHLALPFRLTTESSLQLPLLQRACGGQREVRRVTLTECSQDEKNTYPCQQLVSFINFMIVHPIPTSIFLTYPPHATRHFSINFCSFSPSQYILNIWDKVFFKWEDDQCSSFR